MDGDIRFQHFEVLTRPDGTPHVLGQGAMGTTYKAFDRNLHSLVVVKVINEQFAGNPVAKQRFLQEAQAMARIRHPNVADIFHLGAAPAGVFYAMEFCDGPTLQHYVERRGRVAVGDVLSLGQQAAGALDAIHHAGLIHRDIKPSNVLLTRDLQGLTQVKVIDFGLVRPDLPGATGADLTQGGFVGTPTFASPEQLLERGDLDIRSDIYSLGVTLWFALAGRPPFTGSQFEVMFHHINSAPPWDKLPEMPGPARDVLARMLEKDPARRFAGPRELRRALRECLSSVPGLAPAEGAPDLLGDEPAAGRHGAIIGRSNYEILDEVGHGPHGKTFRARDAVSGETVALKFLSPAIEDEADRLAAVRTEARKLQGVFHPNLVRIIDFQHGDDGAKLVSEWVEGEALGDLLEGQAPGRASAVGLFAQLADALGIVATAGLPHAELAPDRILVVAAPDREGGIAVKVNPLGLAWVGQAEAGAARGPAAAAAALAEMLCAAWGGSLLTDAGRRAAARAGAGADGGAPGPRALFEAVAEAEGWEVPVSAEESAVPPLGSRAGSRFFSTHTLDTSADAIDWESATAPTLPGTSLAGPAPHFTSDFPTFPSSRPPAELPGTGGGARSVHDEVRALTRDRTRLAEAVEAGDLDERGRLAAERDILARERVLLAQKRCELEALERERKSTAEEERAKLESEREALAGSRAELTARKHEYERLERETLARARQALRALVPRLAPAAGTTAALPPEAESLAEQQRAAQERLAELENEIAARESELEKRGEDVFTQERIHEAVLRQAGEADEWMRTELEEAQARLERQREAIESELEALAVAQKRRLATIVCGVIAAGVVAAGAGYYVKARLIDPRVLPGEERWEALASTRADALARNDWGALLNWSVATDELFRSDPRFAEFYGRKRSEVVSDARAAIEGLLADPSAGALGSGRPDLLLHDLEEVAGWDLPPDRLRLRARLRVPEDLRRGDYHGAVAALAAALAADPTFVAPLEDLLRETATSALTSFYESGRLDRGAAVADAVDGLPSGAREAVPELGVLAAAVRSREALEAGDFAAAFRVLVDGARHGGGSKEALRPAVTDLVAAVERLPARAVRPLSNGLVEAADTWSMAAPYRLLAGSEPDAQQRFDFYQRAAELGDHGALAHVGRFYLSHGVANGDESEVALGQAKLEEAASAGDPAGQFLLGEVYFSALGVPEDIPEATRLARAALEAGHPGARFLLGKCLLRHAEIEGDPDAYAVAAEVLEAAGGESPAAFYFLYIASWNAHVQDAGRAASALQHGAAAGDPASQFTLGLWVSEGNPPLEQNPSRAREHMLSAARQAHAPAREWLREYAAMVAADGSGSDRAWVEANRGAWE